MDMTLVILNGLVVCVVQGNLKLVDVRVFLETLQLKSMQNQNHHLNKRKVLQNKSQLNHLTCQTQANTSQIQKK